MARNEETTGPIDAQAVEDAAASMQETTVMQPVEDAALAGSAAGNAAGGVTAGNATRDAAAADALAEDFTVANEPVRASSMRPVVQIPTESVQSTFKRNEGRIHHGVAASIITVLAFLLIGLGSGIAYRHIQSERDTAAILAENERRAQQMQQERERIAAEEEQQRELELARAPRDIKFIVNAIEYDSTATRTPIVVTGIDAEGNEVYEEAFINAAGEGLALPPGDYNMTVAASPVKADGSMYTIPATTFSFKVSKETTDTVQVDQAIVMIPLAKDKTTIDMLNNAYTWAVKDVKHADVVEANFSLMRTEIEAAEARRSEQDRQNQINETRKALAQSFAQNFFTNISFPNTKDDSEILVITNWSAIAAQYVAPNSAAQKKLASGPDPEDDYTFAISANATGVSGDTVTVDCTVVATSKPTNGWTKNTYPATMRCTFDANNKITTFTID